MEARRRPTCHLLIRSVLFFQRRLCRRHQRLGFFRSALRQRLVPSLVVGVVAELERWAWAVQLKWIAVHLAQRGVIPEQRPVAARNREILLLHATLHID